MNNNSFNSKTILIVGGAGFVGSNLVHQLLEHNPNKIIIIDNLLSSDLSNVPLGEKVNLIIGSINDKNVLKKIPEDIDYAFHLACFHGNQSSIHDPFSDHENNTLSTLNLFDKLNNLKTLKKVVYASAACAVAEKTYGTPIATSEDAPISLYHDSPYSISKVIGEFYGNYYFVKNNFPIVKARFSNVYGPREILGAGKWRGTIHTIWRNVIPTFIWKCILGDDLTLDNNGQTTRDFVYVNDMVLGLMKCALKGEKGEVYNLASGNGTKIIDLAKLIKKETKSNSRFIFNPPRSWDRSGKRFASTEKSYKNLGFKTNVSIEDGIVETIKWTLSNRDLIQNCINSHKSHLNKEDIKKYTR